MTKKVETKEETKLTYDQQLLADIKHNETQVEELSVKIQRHLGALEYAKYAYQEYMKTIEEKEVKED